MGWSAVAVLPGGVLLLPLMVASSPLRSSQAATVSSSTASTIGSESQEQ